MNVTEVRTRLIDFVEADLIGPAHGETEVLEDQPKVRYTAGVLFPQETPHDESATAGGVESTDATKADTEEGDTVPPDDAEEAERSKVRSRTPDTDYDAARTCATTPQPSLAPPDGRYSTCRRGRGAERY